MKSWWDASQKSVTYLDLIVYALILVVVQHCEGNSPKALDARIDALEATQECTP